VYTYQRCFFPEVRSIAGDHYLVGDVALTALASQTVNTALAGA